MGRAAQQRLAHHGGLHQLLARERAAQQFVDPVDGGGRRGGARPDAAAGSDLFEDLHLDPHRTAVSFEQGPYGGRDDVFFDISGEFHPAAVTDSNPSAFSATPTSSTSPTPSSVRPITSKPHPRFATVPGAKTLICFIPFFFDELNYLCLIFCFRSGSLGRDVHTQVCGRNIDY